MQYQRPCMFEEIGIVIPGSVIIWPHNSDNYCIVTPYSYVEDRNKFDNDTAFVVDASPLHVRENTWVISLNNGIGHNIKRNTKVLVVEKNI